MPTNNAAKRNGAAKSHASKNGAAKEPRAPWTYAERSQEPDFHAPEVALKTMDQVDEKLFVWEGRAHAPRGSVTVIAGEHGAGKSLLAIDWAACISAGYPAYRRSAGEDARWAAAQRKAAAAGSSGAPGAGAQPSVIHPSDVVIAHAGDMPRAVLRRRIDAAGGAPERIASLTLNSPAKEVKFTFEMLRRRVFALTCAIGGTSDVRLLVIDNLEAFAGNIHEPPSPALLGFLLANLAELAELANIAIVALVSLPRAGGQAAARKLDALCNAAPVVYLAADDPDRAGRKLLATVKNNLAVPAPTRPFEIVDGAVVWSRETLDVSADEFIAPLSRRLEARHERESAARWLLAALADGPVASRELFRQARDCGISTRTLRRAAQSLGLSPRKTSFDGPWQWQLGEFTSPTTGEPEASASVLNRATAAPKNTEANASGSPRDASGSAGEQPQDGQGRAAAMASPPASHGNSNGQPSPRPGEARLSIAAEVEAGQTCTQDCGSHEPLVPCGA